MKEKVNKALDRLISVLPLKEKQESCGPEIKGLHQKVLQSFVEQGRILSKQEMKQHVPNVDQAIATLKENDMVVFSETGEPVGAYPFTMEEREHKVNINHHDVHAMCALDALSVSCMFDMKTKISSVCRVTQDPIFIEQSGKTIENESATKDVCFGIAWESASACSCCAQSLCMEMMFLKNKDTAKKWQSENPQDREIFTLQEAVEFGSRFFSPLMD